MKKALLVAKSGYLDFITSKKLIIMFFSLIFIGEDIYGKMAKVALESGFDLGALEPFILINSYKIHAMIIPIVFIVLMSDFPSVNRSGFFALSRINRKAWFLGEQICALMIATTYMVVMFLGSFLWSHKHLFLHNTWSPYMTALYKDNYDTYQENNQLFIKTETLSQGNPMEVFVLSVVLMVLFLVTISSVLAMFKMLYLKKLGIFVSLVICVAGIWMNNDFKWIFPINHSIFAEHFNAYLAKPELPLIYSFIYYGVLIFALGCVDVFLCKNFNIDEKNEE